MLAHGAGPSRRRRHLQPAGRDGHNPAPSAISAINATMSVSFMMKLYQAWYVVRSATYLQMLTLYSDWNSAHRSMISTLLPSIRFLLAVVAFLLLIYHIISYRIVCQGVCGEFSWVGFHVVCFLYKPIPTHEKLFAVGKSGPIVLSLSTYFFLGWVGLGLGGSSVS